MVLVDDDDVSDFEVLYRDCRNKAYIIAYKILKTKVLRKNVFQKSFFCCEEFQKVNNLVSYEQHKYIVISVRNRAFNILAKEEKIH